jgi:hypothetical protein
MAQPPKHPGAEKAMAKIVLEKDFGDDLKFHSRQVVTMAHNDKVPGLNGLMFMRWKGEAPGTEVMASVQWFEETKDLLAFYDQSKKREDYKLGEFDGTKVWKIGEAGYSWTDGEHFLVSLGGSPAPPPEMVKAWLAMIASKVAEVEKEDEEKPASAGTVAIGSGAEPKGSLAERREQPDVKQPKQRTQAIELFVDLSLGVCDEQTARKRLKTLQVKNLMAAVKAEIEGLEGDLVGIRQVTGEQFAALTRRMEIVSSSISIATLGVTRDRAYLEVSVFLTSKHGYVAVVTTELGGLPEEVVNKLKQAESPDGKANEEIQFDLPVPEVDVEPGEVEPELRLILPNRKANQ